MQIRQFDRDDVAKNKGAASVGYLLFFVPLLACPKSQLGRFCANQGLLIWIAYILLSIALTMLGYIPLLGGLFIAVRWIVQIAIAACAIYMLVRLASQGEANELPYIGHYRLIP